MAGRYLRLLISVGAQGPVLVTGGLAGDGGLLRALAEAAGEQRVPFTLESHCHSAFAGALGAALWGAFRVRKLAQKGLAVGTEDRVGIGVGERVGGAGA
jgi:benzoyl-CoA reductase subunit D